VSAAPAAALIRTVTEADVPALQRYATALFAERLPGMFRRDAPTRDEELEFLHSRIDPVNSTLIMADQDGEIVGLLDFAGGVTAEQAHSGVFGISVAAGVRGYGVGTRLVETLLEWAPTVGVRRVEVRAFANNPRAIALYRRLGFAEEGRLHEAVIVDGEPVDVIVLARVEAR
jgi:RimJ/RimL family protein N-acetyltransferase